MGTLEGLIKRELADEGYVEKATNMDLDSKTGNKGSGNYTKYARDVDAWGLKGYQGQPWCCTMQFAHEGYEFGVEKALEHWNMTRKTYVGYNCFATYNAFKKAGKTGTVPKLGAVVIFNFSHAGRVVRVYSKNGRQWFDCLEGNTSANLSDRNGGQVKLKTRAWNDPTVKGRELSADGMEANQSSLVLLWQIRLYAYRLDPVGWRKDWIRRVVLSRGIRRIYRGLRA